MIKFEDVSFISSGIDMFDEKLGGGFKEIGAYLLASEKKAGKSSFMRKLIFNFLSLGKKVFLIDLEERDQEIFRTLCSIAKEKDYSAITEQDFEDLDSIVENFAYLDCLTAVDALYSDGEFDNLALNNLVRRQADLGADILVFDNVTRIGAENSYNARMKVMADLARTAKECGILVFVVGHTPSSEIETIDKKTITDAIETGQFERLFSDLCHIVQPPKEPYGGSVTSQFDAVLKVHRPMQYFESTFLQSVAWIVVDEIRNASPFRIRLEYVGNQRNFKFIGSVIDQEKQAFMDGWKTA